MRMFLQELAHATAQNPRAVAVNHADFRQPGEKCAVEILFKFVGRFIHGAPDQIDLHPHCVRVGAGYRNMHAYLLPRRTKWIGLRGDRA